MVRPLKTGQEQRFIKREGRKMQNVSHNPYLNSAICVVVLKLGRFGSTSEIHENFRGLVLEKDGEDQLD
jgi:hypothetical protein